MTQMFIEVEPILIPINTIKTQPQDCIGLLFKNWDNALSHLTDLADVVNSHAYLNAIPQHLYLISDYGLSSYRPILINEHYYNPACNEVVKRLPGSDDKSYFGLKKAFAGTNKKFDLPGIPDTLMKQIVDYWHKTKHLPGKILIEVEHSDLEEEKKKHGVGPENLHKISLIRLKLTEDNKIIQPDHKTFLLSTNP